MTLLARLSEERRSLELASRSRDIGSQMHEKNEGEKEKRMKTVEGDGQLLYYLRMRQLFCTSSRYMALLRSGPGWRLGCRCRST